MALNLSSTFFKLMTLVVSYLLFLINTVHADVLCPGTDNVYCDGYEEYCCGSSCCLHDWHYDYGFWNIWYFWFIIFFILMSCCGGCGFYRRRQVFLTQHQADTLAQGPPGGNTTVLGAGHTTYSSTMTGHSLVAHPMMFPHTPSPQAYIQGPPSYTEVTSKPDMYPKAHTNPNVPATVPYPTVDPTYTQTATGLPYPVTGGAIPHQTAIPPSYSPGVPLTHTDSSAVSNGVARTPSCQVDIAPPPDDVAPPPYTPYASNTDASTAPQPT